MSSPSDPDVRHYMALHHAWLTIYYHYRLACWDSPMDEARAKTNSTSLVAVEKAMKDHQARFPEKILGEMARHFEGIRLALKTGYQVERRRRERNFGRIEKRSKVKE